MGGLRERDRGGGAGRARLTALGARVCGWLWLATNRVWLAVEEEIPGADSGGCWAGRTRKSVAAWLSFTRLLSYPVRAKAVNLRRAVFHVACPYGSPTQKEWRGRRVWGRMHGAKRSGRVNQQQFRTQCARVHSTAPPLCRRAGS